MSMVSVCIAIDASEPDKTCLTVLKYRENNIDAPTILALRFGCAHGQNDAEPQGFRDRRSP